MRVTVVRSYVVQYPDPISVRAGQAVEACHRDEEYPGWRWCRGVDGKEGWVPEQLLVLEGQQARLLRDYSAVELAAQPGDELEVIEEMAGWTRATDSNGRVGWLPTRCLTGA
jgi:SH3-like domain-containing protein